LYIFVLSGCIVTNDSEAFKVGAHVSAALAAPTAAERIHHLVLARRELAELASEPGAVSVPEQTIDELVLLLADRSTTLLACQTLELVGARASRALPAVEAEIEALTQEEARYPLGSRTPTVARRKACAASIRQAAT